MRIVIVGCGYIGRRVGDRYRGSVSTVVGIVRSSRSTAALRETGLDAMCWDLDRPVNSALSLEESRVFYLVPPPSAGLTDPRADRMIQMFKSNGDPERVVLISTTGVYGDCGGQWVDEEQPVRPTAPRAKRRWYAEQAFAEWSRRSGRELVVLRVPGIYGPGRLPIERIRRKVPMVAEEDAPFTNRIHAEDLADICVAAMERGSAGEIYHASDGAPLRMTEYFNRVADHAGLPRPPTIGLAEANGKLSDGMLSYLKESRRLSNRKMLAELGISLRYPTLEEGLKAC